MNLVYLFVSLKKSVIPGFVKNPAGGLTVSSIFFNKKQSVEKAAKITVYSDSGLYDF